MLKNTFLTILLIAYLCAIVGQDRPVGAGSAGLGGSSVMLEDVWTVINNPAGMAGRSHVSLGTSLEQRYFMKELGNYALAAAFPAGNGCFGLGAVFSGYASWIDQRLIVGYGRSFGHRLMTGINLVYIYQKAGGESPAMHQVGYKIGAMVHLTDRFSLGFATFNPFGFYYKSKPYATLPGNIRLGMAYRYSREFLLTVEVEKEMDHSPSIMAGCEMIFKELIFIRLGIRALPVQCSFGAGVRYQRFLLEFSSLYHQYLGFTPIISIQYDIR
jgi:hypothetical protein